MKAKERINRILNLIGYQIVKSESLVTDHVIEKDKDFIEIYDRAKSYTMTSKFRCYSLYKAIRFVIKNKIPGDFVECGVWKGGNALIMADTLSLLQDTSRNIYLYDTYEGMVEPDENDIQLKFGWKALSRWQKEQTNTHNEWCYSSIEEVSEILKKTDYPKENFHLVKGDVLNTLQIESPDSISILRLDTDWYKSTKHELEVLYPKLQKNGILIIDDYGSWAGSKKAVDDYFIEDKLLLHRVDQGSRISHKL